jgi:hypothetical protein
MKQYTAHQCAAKAASREIGSARQANEHIEQAPVPAATSAAPIPKLVRVPGNVFLRSQDLEKIEQYCAVTGIARLSALRAAVAAGVDSLCR